MPSMSLPDTQTDSPTPSPMASSTRPSGLCQHRSNLRAPSLGSKSPSMTTRFSSTAASPRNAGKMSNTRSSPTSRASFATPTRRLAITKSGDPIPTDSRSSNASASNTSRVKKPRSAPTRMTKISSSDTPPRDLKPTTSRPHTGSPTTSATAYWNSAKPHPTASARTSRCSSTSPTTAA